MLTNKFNLPLPLQVWLAGDSYDYVNNPKYISATSILKPVRQIVLSKRLPEQDIDISDKIAVNTGTAIHDGIERSWDNPGIGLMKLNYPLEFLEKILVNPKPEDIKKDSIPVYIEQRAIKEFNGYSIGGKFDFVINGALHDIKTTSVYTYMNDSHAKDYILQGSIYKWLNPEIITSNTLTINFVFTDWSSASAKAKSDYPQSRCAFREYPLMSTEEVEAYLRDKLNSVTENIDKDEADICECSDEELWRSETLYKYYADPTKLTRATKNFTSLEEAVAYQLSKSGKGVIKPVAGTPRRCLYCPAYDICSQRRKYFND